MYCTVQYTLKSGIANSSGTPPAQSGALLPAILIQRNPGSAITVGDGINPHGRIDSRQRFSMLLMKRPHFPPNSR
jgi:hypothetical protein